LALANVARLKPSLSFFTLRPNLAASTQREVCVLSWVGRLSHAVKTMLGS